MSIIFRSTPVTEPFTFESIGKNWNQDRISRPKGFPHYHYLQTEQGEGRIHISGTTYSLRENEGILIAPFLPHSYERSDSVWLTRFISFTGTIANSIPAVLGNRPVITVGADRGSRISPIIDSCMECCSSHPADTETLTVECYRLLLHLADSALPHTLEDDPLYRTYVAPVLRKIEQSYSTELTASDLAGSVYITPQYLSRLFRRFLNCSTYEYLTSYRISRAKELLISKPHMDIRDVAHNTGYSDASHFIVIFKKLTGITPLEFRRQN